MGRAALTGGDVHVAAVLAHRALAHPTQTETAHLSRPAVRADGHRTGLVEQAVATL